MTRWALWIFLIGILIIIVAAAYIAAYVAGYYPGKEQVVLAALTAALVFVTATYVYLTSKAVEASNKQAEIMLNAEYNAAAPVIKLEAGGTGDISIAWENVGKGPALNFQCWIEDEEHAELRAGKKVKFHTAIAAGESGLDTIHMEIQGYKLGVGYVRARYQSVFGKTYESCLIFSTDPAPELKYGEAKEDSTGEPNSSNPQQNSETQKGVMLTVNQMVGFSVVFIGFSMLVTRVSEFNLTLIGHIGYSVAVMVIGFLLMSLPRWYRKKAK